MKRRDALKGIGLSIGYAVATPTIISMLHSCKTDADKWIPSFFTVDEGLVLKTIVDLILPKTELTPGALDVNVPEFLDNYTLKVYDTDQQNKFKHGINEVIKSFNKKVSKLNEEDYHNLLTKYLKADKETQNDFMGNQTDKIIFNTLKKIRETTVWAFKTSEEIGENVLAYDPVPGKYYCGDLDELTGGKAWSL